MADIPVNASPAVVVVDVVTNGQVTFDFDFRADEIGDMKAIYRPSSGASIDLQGGIDFTATGLETEDGGTITLTSFTATVAGSQIAIYRDIIIDRENDYQRDVFADDLNREQDKIFMILQEQARDIDRSAKSPIGSDGVVIIKGALGSVPIYDAYGNLTSSIYAGDISSSQVYAAFAREWAVSSGLVDDTVNPVDYSARHYANIAQQYVSEAQDAVEAAISFLSGQVTIVQFSAGVTVIPLPTDPGSVNNVKIVQGGVPQNPNTYAKTGSGPYSITLSEAATEAGWLSYGNAVTVNTPADGSVTTDKLQNDAVTFAKLQNITTSRLLGRVTAGTGDPEEVTAAQLRDAFLPVGSVIDSVTGSYALNADITGAGAVIPVDDTIPQITEGVEVINVKITPKAIGNKIRIRYSGFMSINVIGNAVAAVFNGNANAIQASVFAVSTANYYQHIVGEVEYTPASLAEQTISLRVGVAVSSHTLRMNGSPTGRLFGGSASSRLTVEEIKG